MQLELVQKDKAAELVEFLHKKSIKEKLDSTGLRDTKKSREKRYTTGIKKQYNTSIYKRHCGNFRSVKLLRYCLKLWNGVVKNRIESFVKV